MTFVCLLTHWQLGISMLLMRVVPQIVVFQYCTFQDNCMCSSAEQLLQTRKTIKLYIFVCSFSSPKEFIDCIGHIRLMSWLLIGSLTHTAVTEGAAPISCLPVPLEASCHIADHIMVIMTGFAEQSNVSRHCHSHHGQTVQWTLTCPITLRSFWLSLASSPVWVHIADHTVIMTSLIWHYCLTLCVWVCMYVSLCVCMHACMCVCVCVSVCMCIHACMCVQMELFQLWWVVWLYMCKWDCFTFAPCSCSFEVHSMCWQHYFKEEQVV